MGRTYNTHGTDTKCVSNFGLKTFGIKSPEKKLGVL
jgi:hypothetical protein